ncbi:MAG: hypothetical protein R3E87_23575 [Burkholderiaceae bacterium]
MSAITDSKEIATKTVTLLDDLQVLAAAIDGLQTVMDLASDAGVSIPLGHLVAVHEPIRALALRLMEDGTRIYLDLRQENRNDETR